MKLEQAIYIKEYLKRTFRQGPAFEDCELTLCRDDVVELINLLNKEIAELTAETIKDNTFIRGEE